MMSALPAPMALRMPISRVRSVTVTSMMFMTPIPPTSREIAGDRRRAAAVKIEVIVLDGARIAAELVTVKSRSAAVVPCRASRIRSTSAWAASTVSAEVALTEMRAEVPVAGEGVLDGGGGRDDPVVLVLRAGGCPSR